MQIKHSNGFIELTSNDYESDYHHHSLHQSFDDCIHKHPHHRRYRPNYALVDFGCYLKDNENNQ